MNNKVVLIGCGNVGASYAYAMLNQRTYVNELVIIDVNQDKALGDVMDLNHCLPFAPSKIKIKVGSYQDVLDADIVCITAGFNQKDGETRLDLTGRNKQIIDDIVTKVMENDFKGIFLVATNPVDIMSHFVFEKSKIAANRVIGTGTSLDSSRLRYLVGEKLNINPKNIHAYVIGEHGDSEFVPWTSASVGLNSIKNYLNDNELKNICLEVKNSAYDIIAKKGFTNFGIGVCLARITNAILGDENTIITISSYDIDNKIFISQPAIINRLGIKEIIKLELTDEENNLFLKSVNEIKDVIDYYLK